MIAVTSFIKISFLDGVPDMAVSPLSEDSKAVPIGQDLSIPLERKEILEWFAKK
jgi:hypothetical protein